MFHLHNISFGHRVALTFIIVLVVLLILALYGWLTGRWDEDEHTGYVLSSAYAQTEARRLGLQPLPASKYERRLLELDREAADQAYKEQIMHLFQTWMKDEREQPLRANTGARQARAAYERVLTAIEERDRETRDKPP